MSWSTVAADIAWDPMTWTSVPGVTETELSSAVQSQVLNALEAIYNTGGIGQTMLDSLAGAGPIRIANNVRFMLARQRARSTEAV